MNILDAVVERKGAGGVTLSGRCVAPFDLKATNFAVPIGEKLKSADWLRRSRDPLVRNDVERTAETSPASLRGALAMKQSSSSLRGSWIASLRSQ
jgi:hypothetical protein